MTSKPRGGFWRWQWDAWRSRLENPRPDVQFSAVPHRVTRGPLPADELRLTWIGHATLLVQTSAANVLFDPIWSRRASPVSWAGPARHAPPGVPLADLPRLDALLVSHDHYDHLDRRTIETLARGNGSAPPPLVVTPPGYAAWMRGRGVRRMQELAWNETLEAPGVRVTALPVRHWSRRSLWERNARGWCGFLVESGGFRIFFCGDSGYFDGFAALASRVAPLDVAALPIGAYEPRWFMRDFHMNPDEAVQAYLALGGDGIFLPIHWGTFVLSDEPLDEPPRRLLRAWDAAGLPRERLWIPAHGETRVLRRMGDGSVVAAPVESALVSGADLTT